MMIFEIGKKHTEKGVIEGIGSKAKNLHLLALSDLDCKIPSGFIVKEGHDCKSAARLNDLIKVLGDYPVAVRSSCSKEDLHGASFAGMYESYLNICNDIDLQEAIKKCFASAEMDRVKDYNKKRRHSLDESGEQVNVLVQKMISSKWSGVAFSMHPVSGKEEVALVEVVQGLGEKLVSGTTTPNQYQVEHETRKVIVTERGDENFEVPSKFLLEIARSSLEIAAFFQCPQDIEWAIDENNVLWILQARPITTIHWRKDLGEYTNADFKDGGVSARVCTPLMYSLYDKCVQKSMGEYFQKIGLPLKIAKEDYLTYKYGRIYWNVGAIKETLFQIPGFDEKVFDEDLGIEKDYGENGPFRSRVKILTLWRGIRTLYGLYKERKKCQKFIIGMQHRFEKIDQKFKAKLKHISSVDDQVFFSDFLYLIDDFYFSTESLYFRTIYNNSNLQTEFKDLLRSLDKETGRDTKIIDLLGGLKNVGHLNIESDLVKLASVAENFGIGTCEWKKELNDFLSHHYHHGEAELDIRVPRWGEDEKIVEEIVSSLVHREEDSEYAKQRKNRATGLFEKEFSLIEDSIESLGLVKRIYFGQRFKGKLGLVRWYLREREHMREFSTRTYFLVRQYILELARRLHEKKIIDLADDIFFLNIEELRVLVQKKIKIGKQGYLKEKIHYRRLLYENFSAANVPNEFGEGIVDPSQYYNASEDGDKEKILRGIACGPGVYKGQVKVVHNVKETRDLEKTDILVTAFTDPSWTPALGIVSAVITEVGGILSHAAVIGREYGIPAVLNVKGATKILQTGQKVLVDGNLGTITIL